MYYELITSRGTHVNYYVKACAEVFKRIHGGEIVEVHKDNQQIKSSEQNNYYFEKKAA